MICVVSGSGHSGGKRDKPGNKVVKRRSIEEVDCRERRIWDEDPDIARVS